MKRAAMFVLLIGAATLRAQAPPSFAKGVLAFEKKDWAAAESLMREAVAGNPHEVDGTVRISGEWFETYVPHYFLARALARQGKCGEAQREFAESERQGVTASIPDFARHLASRDGCGKAAAAPGKPAKVITEVEVPFDEDTSPPVKPKSRPTPAQPKPVRAKPVQAQPKTDDDQMRARVERSIIEDAVTAYLAGRYDETVRLASATFTDSAAIAQASLFRAAAHYAQYRMSGEKDDALRGAMLSDVHRYRALRPNGKPDPRIFPPTFIALTR